MNHMAKHRATLFLGLALALAAPLLPGGCGSGDRASQPEAAASARAPVEEPAAPVTRPREKRQHLGYLELYTGGAKPGDRVPAIIAIHGLGDSPKNFGSVLEDLEVPARVILPRAPNPHFHGFGWFPYSRESKDRRIIERGIRAGAKKVAALCDNLRLGDRAPVPPIVCRATRQSLSK